MRNKKKKKNRSHKSQRERKPLIRSREWPLNHRHKSRVRFLTSVRALVPPFLPPSPFLLLHCDKRHREDLLHRRIEEWLARFVNGQASGALKVFRFRNARDHAGR